MAISVSSQKKAWKITKQLIFYTAVGTCVIGGLNIVAGVIARAASK